MRAGPFRREGRAPVGTCEGGGVWRAQVPPFKKTLLDAMPYVDFLFGNETEARAFAKSEGWETQDVAEIALKVRLAPHADPDTACCMALPQPSYTSYAHAAICQGFIGVLGGASVLRCQRRVVLFS